MRVKVIERTKDEPFNREIVKIEVEHEGEPTPSRKALREELKKDFGENFVIVKLESKFGFGKSEGLIRVYKKKEDMLELEPKHLLKRDFKEEEKNGEEKEGKQEEGKEEAKQETTQ